MLGYQCQFCCNQGYSIQRACCTSHSAFPNLDSDCLTRSSVLGIGFNAIDGDILIGCSARI